MELCRWVLLLITIAMTVVYGFPDDMGSSVSSAKLAKEDPLAMRVGVDGEGATSGAMQDVLNLHRGLLALPKSGLNNTNDCNNKLCYYMESALSCKALGFGISKLCARYFMGYLFGCSAFPAPSELFNAPSTCATEVMALLPPSLKSSLPSLLSGGGGIDLTKLKGAGNYTKAYLASNFTQNCQRRCFQRYIAQANTFYGTCNDQLVRYANATNQNSLYPLVYTLEGYQEFKNQICVQNENGKNCYDSLAPINPLVHPGKQPINIFDFTCNFLGDPSYNLLVLQGACKQLGANGCCFANQVAMIAQAQTNSSATAKYNQKMKSQAVRMVPPCLMHYLTSTACPSVSATNFCSKGANGNLTTFGGVVRLNNRAGSNQPFPSMYVESQVLYLQGVISVGLPGSFSFSKSKQAVLQVEIIDFAYYNDTVANQSPATQVTPTQNNAWPVGSDYTAAKSGMFRFQFVVEGLDQASSDALYTALTVGGGTCTPGKGGAFGVLDFVYGAGGMCEMDAPAGATVVIAEPFNLPAENGAAGGPGRGCAHAVTWGAMLLATVLLSR